MDSTSLGLLLDSTRVSLSGNVDPIDPILIVMLVQTVVFTVTLVALFLQVRAQTRQVRAQVRAIYEDQYARCQADYSSLIRMLVQQKDLLSVYDDLAKQSPQDWKWAHYTEREKLLYNYIELNYELFERVFYLWQERWIDEETWKGWEVWLNDLSCHPIFPDVVKDNQGMFGTAFEMFVRDKMNARSGNGN